MVSTPDMAGKGGFRRKRSLGPFKGVCMRKWGQWVSEIRVPKSRTRIWLGSYDAPEKAARAYDAALYCLRGVRGRFNFPTEKRPELPDGSPKQLSKMDIKAIATKFASPAFVPVSMSSPEPLTTPDLSVSAEIEDLLDVGEAISPANVPASESFWTESFLDDPIIPSVPDWLSDL